MSDSETLAVYAAKAEDYANLTDGSTETPEIANFISEMHPGGRVLDLGCGPGHMAAKFAQVGFEVEAMDASPEMIALAGVHEGVSARVETFDALKAEEHFDGIFANFSLLHAKREDVAGHIQSISDALVPNGVFHIGMKTGAGEKRDTLGRKYCYFNEDELRAMLEAAGLSVIFRSIGRDKALSGEMSDWVVLQARKHA